MNPKILFIDIETAPIKAYVWNLWNQDVHLDQIIEPSYVLSYAAKWLGKKEIIFDSVYEHKKSFKKNPSDDSSIVRKLWNLMDEADIIIAHNGDNYDLKWINTLFLIHRMKPISSYKSIDTLKIARSHFKLPSNKLEYIARALDIKGKFKHQGFKMWPKCMTGDEKYWKDMKTYNIEDVLILEKIYLIFRPYIKNHPNLQLYGDLQEQKCVCGSISFRKKGFAYTNKGKYQRLACNKCGKNKRENKNLLTKEQKENILNNCL